MKTRFTLLALFVALVFSVKAQQVPNASFEDWTLPYTPDDWTTIDGLFGAPLGLAVKDTADKVAGNASLKILSDSLALAPQAGVIPGLASLGTGVYIPGPNPPEFYGVPFAFRPDTIFFAYKYSSPGADTAALQIIMTETGNAVFGGAIGLPPTAGQWILAYVPLTNSYLSSDVPDTLLLQFYASAGQVAVKGSTLNVDIVSFGYAQLPNSLQEIATKLNISVYPNPATEFITVAAEEDVTGFRVVVTDINGRIVAGKTMEGQRTQISIAELASGTYIYRIANRAGHILKQDKFNVVK